MRRSKQKNEEMKKFLWIFRGEIFGEVFTIFVKFFISFKLLPGVKFTGSHYSSYKWCQSLNFMNKKFDWNKNVLFLLFVLLWTSKYLVVKWNSNSSLNLGKIKGSNPFLPLTEFSTEFSVSIFFMILEIFIHVRALQSYNLDNLEKFQ